MTNRGSPEKAERNKLIVERCEDGESFAEIGRRWEITGKRVSQIYMNYLFKLQQKDRDK